ncbi:LysR family transcriptional regulator [Desulfobacter hydrogenophilus]|uniref:HTH-type transcriptional regulator MetR n=1 Tax=Desulfobacter hydrogenophilus TaxID=2291 RepID=A0A328FF39_9BACT|nr:LysR family transcriptional regulator [Desulfobacter hydrogenophilus]NDY71122.1 LysR family transcriptional regulator [Desulfobacter hydrogenophilus]QBH14275.1 LysR family transcriptional regulator [Desulfobacter hydrogenophilus]RAM02796.1 LysR family transcriptional regulator [Desulfobacter hydrogenophilus]
MIDRIHLSILNEIDRKGTLTAAAQALCLTQPALTHTMKKLESSISTRLWQKDGRGLRLTRSGRYLLEVSRKILPQFAQAEKMLEQYAQGKRGMLCIGMECHPCYRWFSTIVAEYLTQWTDVELDVKQEFQFDGIQALLDFEIDLLITPDPVKTKNLSFTPLFEYEHVLAVPQSHSLAQRDHILAEDLLDQVLITYPVPLERLDIFTRCLIPAQCRPQHHKTIETTDIILQMVASGRGITALPRWLVEDSQERFGLKAVPIGPGGIWKEISAGIRDQDSTTDYIQGFIALAG